MCRCGTWERGLGSAGIMVGLDGVRRVLWPKWIYDSSIPILGLAQLLYHVVGNMPKCLKSICLSYSMSEQVTCDNRSCVDVAYRVILGAMCCSIYAMFKNQSVTCLLLPKPYLHFHNPFLIIFQCIFIVKEAPYTVKTNSVPMPSEWKSLLFLPSPLPSHHHPPQDSHGALAASEGEGETGKV